MTGFKIIHYPVVYDIVVFSVKWRDSIRVAIILVSVILANMLLVQAKGPGINIYVTYDPTDNYGALNIEADYPEELNSTVVEIPLPGIGGGEYGTISVSTGEGRSLTYTYNSEAGILRILVNESTRKILVDAYIYNVAEEVGVDTYVIALNFTPYTGSPGFHAKLVLMGSYNATIVPTIATKKPSVSRTSNTTIIDFYEPDTYIVVITSTLTPPSSGGGGTGGGATTPHVAGGGPEWLLWMIIIIGALAGLAGYYYYRRMQEPEIINIPPTELLSDETIREIILYVGDAGPDGLRQSRLVRLTHRPKSTISRRLKRLSNEGYVEIIRMGKHNIVKLTPKGYEAYKKIKKSLS